MKKTIAIGLLTFLLLVGGKVWSQSQGGGMMGSQRGMMDMAGQFPMMGMMMNMMSQCASMMEGQQMGQMVNQCMELMGGRPLTSSPEPRERGDK